MWHTSVDYAFHFVTEIGSSISILSAVQEVLVFTNFLMFESAFASIDELSLVC